MNEWLLDRLEASPDSRFYEWELKIYCDDFEHIVGEGLLVRDLEAEQSESCFTKWGQYLHLERLDGVIFGVDILHSNGPITEVNPEDLIQYRFNLGRWQEMIRAANRLHGKASWLHKRLLFLGENVNRDLNLGFVLGFLTPLTALDPLLSLPNRMPSRYDAIIVTTPISSPLAQTEIANLERLGIYVMPPLNRDTLTIECPRLQAKQHQGHNAVLSCVQEADYDRYEYKCRLPIRLTGRITKVGNNEVLIGNTPVEIGDVPFMLFLRLILELRCNKLGMVLKTRLRSEGYFGEGTDDQSINRLRNCFVRALDGLAPKDFIENYRRKTVRISVHPDLITWDAKRLPEHDHAMVRELVRQLGETVEANATGPS